MSDNRSYRTTPTLYIGESSDGNPVFFDLHSAVYNQKPPVTVITGSPGTGKTFLGSILVMNSAIVGKQTVVIDPKGDFLPLKGLQNDVGDVTVWNLSDTSKTGILDPFEIESDPSSQLSLATNIIHLFLGDLDREDDQILRSLIKDVIEKPNPSLYKIMIELRRTQGDDERGRRARSLGSALDAIAVMRYSKLCFSPSRKSREIAGLSKNLTIITLLGLPLPKNDEEAKKPEGRLSTGIIYLVTYLIDKLLTRSKDKLPKTLFIDEAWVILRNAYGAALVESIALLGRSLNMIVVLATQSNSHLNGLDIDTTISTRFAFGTDKKEAATIVKDMNLPEGEGFEGVFMELGNGVCIMQDWDKRYSAVRIHLWKDDWVELLKTNPKDRLEKALKEI